MNKVRALFLVFLIESVLVWFACIAFSALMVREVDNTLKENDNISINSIGINWARRPIISFSSCSADNHLTDAFWDGTVEGCDLNGGASVRGSCESLVSHSVDKVYGHKIPVIDPIRLLKWKDIEFCGETIGNYFDLNIVAQNESCRSGTKACGVIDSLDNILCVNASSDCPITSIKFSASKPNEGSSFISGKNIYLEYSKQPVATQIPIQFKVSEGKICADPSQRDIKRDPYFLETFYNDNSCKNEVGSSFFNNHFTILDIYQLKELYEENNVTEILSNLDGIRLESYNIPVNFYSRSFIGLTKECRDSLRQNSDLVENLTNLSLSPILDEKFGFKLNLIACYFLSVAFMITIPFYFSSKVKWVFGLNIVSLVAQFILYGSIISHAIIIRNRVENAKVGLEIIIEQNCSDSITNENVRVFSEELNDMSNYLLTIIILNLYGPLIESIMLLIYRCLTKRYGNRCISDTELTPI